MTPRSVPLIDPEQAKAAMAAMYRDHVKHPTSNGHRLRLTVRDETRRDEQNAHFHALIGQIAEHIGGDLADEDDAKRILLSAFKIDTVRDPDLMDEWARLGDLRMGRGLRGETVLLGNQTRTLSVKLAAAFIHWLNAFGIEHGVTFRSPKSWGPQP
ncbi:recombination protein NinB [Variovorax sp. N23]|uniref:recombination protein NinB n=1 Tax=Variovorax sp. N23 TaxID=2980555 RepID=UPI0021C68797|nr:recombination protein NinB [Variovorax sp. N23]MCU4119327.1 recombination protein NinB [Variovorax sp. N23]